MVWGVESFVVREDRCIRCGACATLAPEVFALRSELLVVRQPAGKDEATRAMAALLNCPSQAIGVERQ
jgi:ferredoxin